jgi:hypothetical protein
MSERDRTEDVTQNALKRNQKMMEEKLIYLEEKVKGLMFI